MAVLHKKEEKIQAVLGRLPKTYTQEEFVAMFIKLYSKDWGKIKSAYNKQAQDKEPGTVINMPKPDLYLKQVLDIYLKQNAITQPVEEEKPLKETTPVAKVKPIKEAAKKKDIVLEAKADKKPVTKTIKKEPKQSEADAPVKEKVVKIKVPIAETKPVRAPAKKKAEGVEAKADKIPVIKAAKKEPKTDADVPAKPKKEKN